MGTSCAFVRDRPSSNGRLNCASNRSRFFVVSASSNPKPVPPLGRGRASNFGLPVLIPSSVNSSARSQPCLCEKKWFSMTLDCPARGAAIRVIMSPIVSETVLDISSRVNRSCRSEEHTSELQSLMRISYAVFCLKKKKNHTQHKQHTKKITK